MAEIIMAIVKEHILIDVVIEEIIVTDIEKLNIIKLRS